MPGTRGTFAPALPGTIIGFSKPAEMLSVKGAPGETESYRNAAPQSGPDATGRCVFTVPPDAIVGFSKPIENVMGIRARRRARARHMVQNIAQLGSCDCQMVEITARPETDASQTQVWLETVVDTVAKPTFWWKPLWKPL